MAESDNRLVEVKFEVDCSFSPTKRHIVHVILNEIGYLQYLHSPCAHRSREMLGATRGAANLGSPTCALFVETFRAVIEDRESFPSGIDQRITELPDCGMGWTSKHIRRGVLSTIAGRASEVRGARMPETPLLPYLSQSVYSLSDEQRLYRLAHSLNESLIRRFPGTSSVLDLSVRDRMMILETPGIVKKKKKLIPIARSYWVGRRREKFILDAAQMPNLIQTGLFDENYCCACEAMQTVIPRHRRSPKHARNVVRFCREAISFLNSRLEGVRNAG